MPTCFLQFSFDTDILDSAYGVRNSCQNPPKAIGGTTPFSCKEGRAKALNTSVQLQKYSDWMGSANRIVPGEAPLC